MQNNLNSFSQTSSKASSTNNTNIWISQRYNLNITMSLNPKVPIIDENTKNIFELKRINGSEQLDLDAKVTMTDHDGRLYKFGEKLFPILNGQFSVNYIFPDDGKHRIIIQLYQSNSSFTVASFDLTILHPVSQSNQDRLLEPLTNFFDSFLFVSFR